jgi:hypothetical protein
MLGRTMPESPIASTCTEWQLPGSGELSGKATIGRIADWQGVLRAAQPLLGRKRVGSLQVGWEQ